MIAGETYTLHEVISPDGYEIANDIQYTVSNDGSVDEVVMYDELTPVPQETPKTGDTHSNLLAWLMIAGGLATMIIATFRKKKEISDSERAELEQAKICPDFIDKDGNSYEN